MHDACVGCHASQNQDTCLGCRQELLDAGTHVEVYEEISGVKYARCYEKSTECGVDCFGHGTCYKDYNGVSACKCDVHYMGSLCHIRESGVFDEPSCPGGVCSCAQSNCATQIAANEIDGTVFKCETIPNVKFSSGIYKLSLIHI